MKQTIEKSYDPGPLLLDGPHATFTKIDQMLSKNTRRKMFSVSIEDEEGVKYKFTYQKDAKTGLKLYEEKYDDTIRKIILRPYWSHDMIAKKNPFLADFYNRILEKEKDNVKELKEEEKAKLHLEIKRNRCFLEIKDLIIRQKSGGSIQYGLFNSTRIEGHISGIIHLPALRGNPKRLYPKTAIGLKFPGTFENYTASIITKWKNSDKEKNQKLIGALDKMGLSKAINTKEVEDTYAEINVSLVSQDKNRPMRSINIADVGFGVSQTLPVIVSLLVAAEGQLVYIEQPEIHLHPKAQYELGGIIVDAANRGVKVVIETHSDILILGIQTLIADGKLDPKDVILHWFSRNPDGFTEINSSYLNIDGSYNHETWPSDFGSINLYAKSRFLTASEKHLAKKGAGGV